MKKRYKLKYDYIAAAKEISKHIRREADMIFEHGSDIHKDLLVYNVLGLFCEEVKVEQWVEPGVKTESWGAYTSPNGNVKAHLLIRMQSWADYHNKLDGFVADWKDRSRYKWGVKIEYRELTKQAFSQSNLFLFQICVSSEARAKQMLDYFHKDIQSLIDKGLI